MRHRRPAGAIRELDAHGERAWRRIEQPHVHVDTGEVGMRREVHEFQRVGSARLEVDGLPHPAGFAVALFAFELEGMRRVVHADHQSL